MTAAGKVRGSWGEGSHPPPTCGLSRSSPGPHLGRTRGPGAGPARPPRPPAPPPRPSPAAAAAARLLWRHAGRDPGRPRRVRRRGGRKGVRGWEEAGVLLLCLVERGSTRRPWRSPTRRPSASGRTPARAPRRAPAGDSSTRAAAPLHLSGAPAPPPFGAPEIRPHPGPARVLPGHTRAHTRRARASPTRRPRLPRVSASLGRTTTDPKGPTPTRADARGPHTWARRCTSRHAHTGFSHTRRDASRDARAHRAATAGPQGHTPPTHTRPPPPVHACKGPHLANTRAYAPLHTRVDKGAPAPGNEQTRVDTGSGHTKTRTRT